MRSPALRLYPDEIVVDSFAGGGGASLGIEMALGRSPDIAVNHDPEAIAMHAANHPQTRHYCQDVFSVDPVEATGGRPVGLAWFSPDCKHFSKAKGGKPVEKKIRDLAWVVVDWARAVKPRIIFLENVEEFKDWGPLLDDGRPCPLQRGLTFKQWVGELRAAGYQVEYRELRACDFGAPTTRKRLFVIARCDAQPIVWPGSTHGPRLTQPYRTAAECIDWSLPCPSIFERSRPLAENTLKRIARGIQRYVVESAEPFIVPVTHQDDVRAHSISEPLRTVTGAHRGEQALVTPFVLPATHGAWPDGPDMRSHAVDEPLRTLTTLGAQFYLVAPYLVRLAQTGGNGAYVNDLRDPLTTIVSKAEHLLVSPTLVQVGYGERSGQAPRSLDLHQPLGTVVAQGRKHALVSAFLARHFGGMVGCEVERPLPTVTATDHHSLVTAHLQRDFGNSVGSAVAEPVPTITGGGGGHAALVSSHLLKLRGGLADHHTTAQDLREPVPTLTAGGTHLAEVRAFLIKYYGAEQQDPQLALPLHTVTTKDRFGLVTVHGQDYAIVDIGMRMLAPRELFRAQGFPDSYRIDIEFKGKPLSKTAQVRMCGNSVCPPLAAALVAANVAQAQEVAV